ncbi:MAG TPA: helix-turn-helix domain-containing protein [Terriglobia bacterium]|nr:helix-turn-helix domain-containing protein [Terriglobia bacterium]
MKNKEKNRSSTDSYSASDAATLLGVSIPTLRRMVKEGALEGFRTPGGHVRVTAESIEAVKDQRHATSRPVREASPVLQNRRDRLEELTLETQELRAKTELGKLRREEQEEAEQREAEAQEREEEAEQHQAEIELQRERLEHAKAQERRRLERERAEEQARFEAEEELAAFRQRWYDAVAEAVAIPKRAWLTAAQRKELTEALEAEIERRLPADEPRMVTIIARGLEALLEPLGAKREAQERRERATKETLWSLPYSATDAEKVKATAAIRDALGHLESFADLTEMRVAAQEAIRPFCQAIERRLLDVRLVSWALQQLPWSRTERDEVRIRREAAEILADLPIDISEVDGKEALEPTVGEARAEVEKRQAEKDRQRRKAGLIQHGLDEVSSYLLKLNAEGEISDKEYWDASFRADMRDAVQRGLEGELLGDEAVSQVRELAREMADEELP